MSDIEISFEEFIKMNTSGKLNNQSVEMVSLRAKLDPHKMQELKTKILGG